MNTAFVKESNVYSFDKKGVDPDSILNNKKFENDFRIDLHFLDACDKCKPRNLLLMLCDKCRKAMPDEVKEWETIKDIVDRHNDEMNIRANLVEKILQSEQQERMGLQK
jgi:hypothetical protein